MPRPRGTRQDDLRQTHPSPWRIVMSDRKFRFGVVAGQAESSAQWTELARRAENMGYATLLSPDTFNVLSPFASLAAAAAVTTELRLGTFVLATPLRTAGSI